MNLETLQEVVIDSTGGYKFIVAEVTDGIGASKVVIRANKDCEYHRDILEKLCEEVQPKGLRARCIGGG